MTMETRLLPYTFVDGVPTLKDSEIVQLYEWSREERSLQTVFYNIDCSSITREWFLRFWKHPGKKIYLILGEGQVGGWVWIDRRIDCCASVHFNMFRWTWGPRALQMCRQGVFELLHMEHNGNGKHKLEVLVGQTPVTNRLAIKFIQKIGFKPIGRIPGALFDFKSQSYVDAYMSYISRETAI